MLANNQKKDDKSSIKCIGCGSGLQSDHTGIKCPNSHDMCPGDCSNNFVSVMLGDPEVHVPAKCMECNVELCSLSIERQLDATQLQLYLTYMAIR